MDPRKWFPTNSLFNATACCYCGHAADTSDHTPPRCLLPKRLPNGFQAMTIPACSECNTGFSADELRVAAIVSTVSFTQYDREAVGSGGWVYLAMNADQTLGDFIRRRMGRDGSFCPDDAVTHSMSRIMTKTATGLLFHEFGRVVPPGRINMIAVEHAKTINSLALVEQYRRDDWGWAEVTPSGANSKGRFALFTDKSHPTCPNGAFMFRNSSSTSLFDDQQTNS